MLLVAGAITAVGTAAAIVWKVVGWMISTVRKLGRLADDLLGEQPRPGLPNGRPGLMDRVASIEESQSGVLSRMEALEAELRPNGGGSIKDQIGKIARVTGASEK